MFRLQTIFLKTDILEILIFGQLFQYSFIIITNVDTFLFHEYHYNI